METAEKTKKEYGSFLRNEIVKVKPIESNGKWTTLLVKGQELRKDPYIYNKAKKSFQVPLNSASKGGGVKAILDDQRKVHIRKYEEKFPEGMTQKEFFEQELGEDLSFTNPTDRNFWRTSRNSRVVMTKEGLTLRLNETMDMLRYLILMSNTSKIAPSFEERNRRATYEFMMVDEDKVNTLKLNEGETKAKAYVKYAEVTRSLDSAKGFIKSLGRTVPVAATEQWIKAEVLTFVESNPQGFLSIVEHPQYKARIFVQNAVEAGAILRKAKDRYTLDNGVELGDLTSVINHLEDPENQELRMRLKARVELFEKNK